MSGKELDLRDFHSLLDSLHVRHLHLLLNRHLDDLVLILDLRHFNLPAGPWFHISELILVQYVHKAYKKSSVNPGQLVQYCRCSRYDTMI